MAGWGAGPGGWGAWPQNSAIMAPVTPAASPQPIHSELPAAQVAWQTDETDEAPPQQGNRSPWDLPDAPYMRADAIGAHMIFNAAYAANAFARSHVRRLNCHWHRPHDNNPQPLGYNPQGDIAPAEVHILLDEGIAELCNDSAMSQRERNLAHSACDLVWFMHSRSRDRLRPAIAQKLPFIGADRAQALAELMHKLALTDLRLVVSVVDPRLNPQYGNTVDRPAVPRVWRHSYSSALGSYRRDYDEGFPGDHGGSSGDEDATFEAPWDRAQQRLRFEHRRLMRLNRDIGDMQEEIKQQREEAERLRLWLEVRAKLE
ncbi:hypothetical protein BKA62DRAFT_814526 [Auriculariales sp. MPI-PUGE-AT-0066]|nr:hypothetical protein BKA62DRAFT_814526 [Auriculariales sp. MPI-PUGE-AT-0066]